MDRTSESPALRSLAIALGSGLVIGAGIRLAQRMRQPAPPVAPGNVAALDTIVGALEKRLEQHSSAVDRRLAAFEARLVHDGRATQKKIETENHTLRQQVIAMNREFAEVVGRIVAEQVAARTAGVEAAVEKRVQ